MAKGGGAEIDRRQRDKAKDFLLAYLPDGAEVRVTQLANEAEQSGITKRTLQRAREDLGVTSRQLTKKEKLAMGLDPLPPVWVCSLSAERRAQIA